MGHDHKLGRASGTVVNYGFFEFDCGHSIALNQLKRLCSQFPTNIGDRATIVVTLESVELHSHNYKCKECGATIPK